MKSRTSTLLSTTSQGSLSIAALEMLSREDSQVIMAVAEAQVASSSSQVPAPSPTISALLKPTTTMPHSQFKGTDSLRSHGDDSVSAASTSPTCSYRSRSPSPLHAMGDVTSRRGSQAMSISNLVNDDDAPTQAIGFTTTTTTTLIQPTVLVSRHNSLPQILPVQHHLPRMQIIARPRSTSHSPNSCSTPISAASIPPSTPYPYPTPMSAHLPSSSSSSSTSTSPITSSGTGAGRLTKFPRVTACAMRRRSATASDDEVVAQGYMCPLQGCELRFRRRYNLLMHFRAHARRCGLFPDVVEQGVDHLRNVGVEEVPEFFR